MDDGCLGKADERPLLDDENSDTFDSSRTDERRPSVRAIRDADPDAAFEP
jgi:hypothetical protein